MKNFYQISKAGLFGLLLWLPCAVWAVTVVNFPFCPQKKAITVDKKMIKHLAGIKPSSANANEVEKLLGPPCSCLTINPPSAESWICQWKGDLSSNKIVNMLNIQFEAGMIAGATAVTVEGMTYILESGGKIKAYPMR